MKKIFNADILDIFGTDRGFIYSCEEVKGSGRVAAFYSYDVALDKFEKLSVNSYLFEKYGTSDKRITLLLPDFITARPVYINEEKALCSYKSGKNVLFSSTGLDKEEFQLTYLDKPALSPAPFGRNLWYAVPGANAIINYSLKYKRIEARLGSPSDRAFLHPTDIKSYDGLLYVCNSSSYKIKTVDPEKFEVNDYFVLNEPVYEYFRGAGCEFAVLQSGVYFI